MSNRIDVVSVIGGRPQIVKAAMVSRAFRQAQCVEYLVDTGQHYDDDMAGQVLRATGMAPDVTLACGGGSHAAMTARMMTEIEPILRERRPGALVVYGDTNSTLAGSLVAAKMHIPVVHVEAGLRSGNRAMPEEVNRVLVDHLAELLLCPTVSAMKHLEREGLGCRAVHVGDVMYDAALWAKSVPSTALDDLGIEHGGYSLLTMHRAESVDQDQPLRERIEYLRDIASDTTLIWPIHPRSRQALSRSGLSTDPIRIVAPVDYVAMAALTAGAAVVYTDSGGLQKEAYFHGTPCVTLRDETEWQETLDAGWNRLWTSRDWVLPRRVIRDYGDGRAAELVASEVLSVVRGGPQDHR